MKALTAPTLNSNAATHHGISHQAITRKQVQSYLKIHIQLRGIHVCKTMPRLSATPDSVVECRDAILEIKCPFVEDCRYVILSKRYNVIEKHGSNELAENGRNGSAIIHEPSTQCYVLVRASA